MDILNYFEYSWHWYFEYSWSDVMGILNIQKRYNFEYEFQNTHDVSFWIFP